MQRLKFPLAMGLAMVVPLLFASDAAEAGKKKRGAEKAASGTLDDGKLVVAWFSEEPLLFRETDDIDYLWVQDGFSIDGKSFQLLEWPDPEIPADRDAKDRRLANQMNRDMATLFADVMSEEWGSSTVSLESGDIEVSGRIVDSSTGSTAAKVLVGFGAGSGNTTIDLKFTDKESGDLLVAMHHRVVSGSSWSTTDSKFVNWVVEICEEIAKKGFDRLYQNGDRIDD